MIVTENNFVLYAASKYTNINCTSIEEFEEDLQRFKYLKKLFFIYKKSDIIKERLILNHLVVLYNVFEPRYCTTMLVFKLEEYIEDLLPFLDLLGYTPRLPINIKDENTFVNINGIERNKYIIETLKKSVKN